MTLLFEGSDWTFEKISKAYDAMSPIALEDLRLDIYPNQIEVISSEQMLDAYAGVWFFAANAESYPGTQRKTQSPLSTFQTHLSYNFEPQLWMALDVTYYVGGRTTVGDAAPTDLQSNVRTGVTAVLPVSQRHSIKIAASRGAVSSRAV